MSHLATTTEHDLSRSGAARRAGLRLRNRSIALAALLFAAAAIAVTLATSGHGHAGRRPASAVRPLPVVSAPPSRHKPTLNQQLQDLQIGVQVAAGR